MPKCSLWNTGRMLIPDTCMTLIFYQKHAQRKKKKEKSSYSPKTYWKLNLKSVYQVVENLSNPPAKKKKKKSKSLLGAPGWLHQLSFRLLVSTGVMISGFWDGEGSEVGVGREESAWGSPSALPLALSLSLSLSCMHALSLSNR